MLCCPAVGDMAENAARVAWAGAGLMLPWRLMRTASLRLAAHRMLSEPAFGAAAREIARWAGAHDGSDGAAALVEQLAG
jgi:UDP:flavonoid glycosyltransferase YjiC (YdhE family)